MTPARPALAFLLLLSAATACDAPPPSESAERPDRGPVGKADAIAGSCVDACGDQAPQGCWCDEQCAEYGDCCSDYVAECVETDDAIGIDAPDEELREAAGFGACTGGPADDALLDLWSESGGAAILSMKRRSCSDEGECSDWVRADHIPGDSFVLDPAEAVTVEPVDEGWRVEVGTLATCVGPADALQCEVEFPLVDEARAEFAAGQLQMRGGCGDLIVSRREFVGGGWHDSLLAVRLERRSDGPISQRLEDQLRTPTPLTLHCNTTHYATRFTCSQPWDYSTRGTLDLSIRMRGGDLETVDAETNVPEPLREGPLQSDSFSNSSYSWRTTVRAAGDRVEIRYSRDTLDNSPSWCTYRTGYLQECVASFVAMP